MAQHIGLRRTSFIVTANGVAHFHVLLHHLPGLTFPIRSRLGPQTINHFKRCRLVEATLPPGTCLESGYSQISGTSIVLMERYFKGAAEVLMIWWG